MSEVRSTPAQVAQWVRDVANRIERGDIEVIDVASERGMEPYTDAWTAGYRPGLETLHIKLLVKR